MDDFYKLLEVDRNASSEDITKSFRRKARLFHPDKNGGNTSGMMELLNQAYEKLNDAKGRAEYDKELALDEDPNACSKLQDQAEASMLSKTFRKLFAENCEKFQNSGLDKRTANTGKQEFIPSKQQMSYYQLHGSDEQHTNIFSFMQEVFRKEQSTNGKIPKSNDHVCFN